MANVEKNCTIKVKNGDNIETVYPITKIANVDGLDSALDRKVNTVSGKGLSTNDYTTTEKNKLAGIANGATANIGTVTGVKVGSTSYSPSSGIVSLPAYPTSLPASDVSSWAKASSKPTYTASEVGAIATSAKGAASGVAELDANGKVPSSQLPSYVDDVLEYSAKSSFPATGETGKIYVDTSNNKTYRWSGSAYVEISPSLALGTTSSTAYRGDRGNTAYSHATDSSRLTTATSSGLYKVASTAQGHIASLTAVAKADITALGIPAQDTTYSAATQSANGLMSSTDKTKLDGIATGANNYSHPTTSGNKHIPSGGSSGQILRWSADGTATWGSDNNTWTAMVGATSSANGSVGYVNAVPPKDGYNTKYLRADGTWAVPPNTTYSTATTSSAGLMSTSDKSKLDGIATGAQVNSITGVKGNSESSYRTGNVNITPSNIGLGNVGNFKAVSTVASQGLSSTEQSNARANIGAGTSSFSGSYNDLSNKPTIPTKTSQLTNDSGYTTNTGTVTGVKVGSTSYSPSSGIVSLPAYPTNTDTHRPIQINGTQLLGNNTTPFNLSAGGHISIEPVSSNAGEARIHLNSWTASIDKRVYLNELTWTQTSSGMYYSSGYFPDFGDYPLRDILACSVRDFNFLSTNYLLPCIFTLQPGIWFMADTGTFPSGAYVDVRIVGTLYYEDIRG